MAASSDVDRLAPEFRIRVAGADLPTAAAADVLEVSVYDDVSVPGMFTCELLNWDHDAAAMTWSDRDTFQEGKELEVQMGYRDALAVLIVGEITALEVLVAAREVPTLVVQGYDRSHRLMRGRRVRTFADMTDADIARQLANDAGLTPEVDSTDEAHPYVLQCNQTDLEFLRQRALRNGYEVVVRNRTLSFRRRRSDAAVSATLDRELDLLEFRSRLSTLAPAPRTTVRGWNPQEKDPLVGRADADAAARMGGTTLGATAVADIFGDADAALVLQPAFTAAEADQVARAAFNDAAMRYIEGEGLCLGRTDIRAGDVVEIAGLGDRFSGPYYITTATHRYSPSCGYRTRFAARRNSS